MSFGRMLFDKRIPPIQTSRATAMENGWFANNSRKSVTANV